MLLIAGCSTPSPIENQNAVIADRHSRAMERCASSDAKSALEKAKCYNAADELIIGPIGSDADLVKHRMAKRIEVAKKIDSGKITKDAGNAEITRVYAQVQSERQRRISQRLATAMQIVQAQQQNNALSSITRSQRRMADAMDDANDIADPSRTNDPFRWAEMYSRGY